MLPFAALPTTEGVRCAIANIIRDIQRQHDLTDLQLASKIEVHVNTIERARNKKGTLDSEILNRLGACFGEEAMQPVKALWGRDGSTASEDPLPAVADALSAISRAKGIKGQMDALPAAKEAAEALQAWILEVERKRLRAA